jgi:hypothetical protein
MSKDAVEGQLLVVGRERAEPAARQRQWLRQSAVHRHRVQLAEEIVVRVHARAENDVFAVVLPAHDDVVRPHAVGDVVAAEGGGEGEALGFTALRGHDVDLGVAVVLGGERDLFAVGRQAREHFEAFVRRQPPGDAAVGRDGVQVAGVGEDDLIAVDGGEAEEAGLAFVGRGGVRPGQAGQQGRRYQQSLH